MTIEEAFAELIESTVFREIAKQKDSEGSKYRVMRSRFKKGGLKALAMVELLLRHGYKVSVKK